MWSKRADLKFIANNLSAKTYAWYLIFLGASDTPLVQSSGILVV